MAIQTVKVNLNFLQQTNTRVPYVHCTRKTLFAVLQIVHHSRVWVQLKQRCRHPVYADI